MLWSAGVSEGIQVSSAGLGCRVQPVCGPAQVRQEHTMQFPAELTTEACKRRPTELRLICVYFLTPYFFQVSGDR